MSLTTPRWVGHDAYGDRHHRPILGRSLTPASCFWKASISSPSPRRRHHRISLCETWLGPCLQLLPFVVILTSSGPFLQCERISICELMHTHTEKRALSSHLDALRGAILRKTKRKQIDAASRVHRRDRTSLPVVDFILFRERMTQCAVPQILQRISEYTVALVVLDISLALRYCKSAITQWVRSH